MARALFWGAICLLAMGPARGDLTDRLVKDSDTMANIVGASETMSLVDYKLHKTQTVRDQLAEDTSSVKAIANKRFLALEDAEKKLAESSNLKRHFKEQLSIISDEDEEKKDIALKADSIAKKMAAMAAKADGAWQEVDAVKSKTQEDYDAAKATAATAATEEAKAQKLNQAAEDAAQKAASKLASVDQTVKALLEKHQKLEQIKAEEDETATTRLANAFKQDAMRQDSFKKAMLSASAAEKQQQLLSIEREKHEEKEVAARVMARKSTLSLKKEASISQLKALEHALLRAHPELDSLRPDADTESSVSGGASSGQTLAAQFGGRSQSAQSAMKARWEQLAAVMGHDSTGGFASAYGNQEEDADFTVPASDTPRV